MLFPTRYTLQTVSTHKRFYDNRFRETLLPRTRVQSVRATSTLTVVSQWFMLRGSFCSIRPPLSELYKNTKKTKQIHTNTKFTKYKLCNLYIYIYNKISICFLCFININFEISPKFESVLALLVCSVQ